MNLQHTYIWLKIAAGESEALQMLGTEDSDARTTVWHHDAAGKRVIT